MYVECRPSLTKPLTFLKITFSNGVRCDLFTFPFAQRVFQTCSFQHFTHNQWKNETNSPRNMNHKKSQNVSDWKNNKNWKILPGEHGPMRWGVCKDPPSSGWFGWLLGFSGGGLVWFGLILWLRVNKRLRLREKKLGTTQQQESSFHSKCQLKTETGFGLPAPP